MKGHKQVYCFMAAAGITLIEDSEVPLTQFYTPQASGSVVYENGKVVLDASNTNQRNAYEVFPFSEGDGSYTIKVFENVSGNSYSQAYSNALSVSLSNEFLLFLYPNQYVNFNLGSAVVQTANQLAAVADDQVAVVNNIYNYVVSNFTYDTAKAQSVESGYLSDVDRVLANDFHGCQSVQIIPERDDNPGICNNIQ